MWRRFTPTTRICRCRPRSARTCSTSRTRRQQPSEGSRWKRRRSSATRCRPVGTWRGWTRPTIDISRSASGGVTGDVAGNRLNNSPEWSGRAWIDWTGDDRSSERRCRFAPTRRGRRRRSSRRSTTRIQRQRAFGLLDISAEFGPSAPPLVGRRCMRAISPTRTTSPGPRARPTRNRRPARRSLARLACNWPLRGNMRALFAAPPPGAR